MIFVTEVMYKMKGVAYLSYCVKWERPKLAKSFLDFVKTGSYSFYLPKSLPKR